MDVSYNNAERLVRTELNYVFNKSALDSMGSAGLDHYRFVAAGKRTSKVGGKRVKVPSEMTYTEWRKVY